MVRMKSCHALCKVRLLSIFSRAKGFYLFSIVLLVIVSSYVSLKVMKIILFIYLLLNLYVQDRSKIDNDGINITQRGDKYVIWDNPPSSCSNIFYLIIFGRKLQQ